HVFATGVDFVPRCAAQDLLSAPRRYLPECIRVDEIEKRSLVIPLAEDRIRVRVVDALIEIARLVARRLPQEGEDLLKLRQEKRSLLRDHLVVHPDGHHDGSPRLGTIRASSKISMPPMSASAEAPSCGQSDAAGLSGAWSIPRSIQPPPRTRSS